MPDSGEQLYDVFLSYSHKDGEKFGMEYILRIKEEIEKALENIITDHAPRVFLDAKALELGDLWHSKIMECLHQCKVVVCLVSEEYLNSDYCTRERLWWNAKQTRDGHFLNLPYPVYFVELKEGIFSDPRVKEMLPVGKDKRSRIDEMMAVQTEDRPWFKVKEELQEEFLRERLNKIYQAVSRKYDSAVKARNYSSVRPGLRPNFVGRVTELRELLELCVNGKFPVIQAAGGVGKTELSVAYACGFADQYPMGRFLFRMERVTSWDEAFSNALEMDGTDANGIPKKVFEELEIDKKELEGKDRREVHEIAAKAFLERAARGKLLILLDNLDEDTALLNEEAMPDFLCGSPVSENIHILATTRGTFRFTGRERFESYELKNLEEDEAFEMLCLTGNGQYPFDRKPPDADDPEYRAAREVIRLLDGHAWSMEIISAFMADNYLNGFTFSKELESLRKENILSISSETGTYRAGKNSATPVQLLRPTLDRLTTLELGAETLELAVFAACFDPDEIPLYLLREYWEMNFPEAVCSKGTPFDYAVNLLARYHLIRKENGEETCKMHRLVQAVFLSQKEKHLLQITRPLREGSFLTAKYWGSLFKLARSAFSKKKETYLAHIIETLPKCSFIPAKYWVPLLLQTPNLIEICPQNGTLSADDWIKLLVNPAFAEKCPWQSLSGSDWADLLGRHPRFADKYNCDLSKLNGRDWARLLEKRPQFENKCDWSKLDGWDWARLLAEQPQFENKCDWSKLDGGDWARLLKKRPQFKNKCDWSKLDGYDWVDLLSKQPQFAEKCDWSKLDVMFWMWLLAEQPQFAEKCDWGLLNMADAEDWVDLLSKQPQFAEKCDWNRMDGGDWAGLLAEQPQFAEKCDWRKLNGWNWAWLLAEQPQFAEKCDWSKLDGRAWARLLAEQPQFENKCDWSKLDGENWADLLIDIFGKRGQPRFGDKCDWSKLDGGDWARLLAEQPQFAEKCDWGKLNGGDWAKLLGEHPEWKGHINFMQLNPNGLSELLGKFPQLGQNCDLSSFDGRSWAKLLSERPEFSEHCDWSKLDGWNWARLLEKRPQFENKCDWSKLDGGDWAWLLGKRPQFEHKCDWSKLDGKNWARLLEKQPQFENKCDWSKLDGSAWAWLLAEQPQFENKCDWSKLDGGDWENLLERQPQFENKCDWSKLNGKDWTILLRRRPQFADKCDWDKLDGENWADLLIDIFGERGQPRFGDKCDWSKLDGANWSSVLADQPQFADKCDWSKLNEDDWENLLECQPQFAEKCNWSKLSEEEQKSLLEKFPELFRK